MSNLHLTTTVTAPVKQVFDAYSDFANAAEVVEGIVRIEMLTEGPVGVGTRFRETRVMFGRESTEEMEITEFKPGELVTVSAESCGAAFNSRFRFTPQGQTTRVDMDMETRPLTLFAKLMWPLGWLMMGSMKKMMQADMEQVKAACENAQPAA